MPIVRYNRDDAELERLVAELATRPQPSEEEIEQHAIEDGGAMTDEELASAVLVCPPPTAERIQALRARLGLTQDQFALQFGFTVDAVKQYEQGKQVPFGPASTLLQIIEGDPDTVMRVLDPCRAKRLELATSPG